MGVIKRKLRIYWRVGPVNSKIHGLLVKYYLEEGIKSKITMIRRE